MKEVERVRPTAIPWTHYLLYVGLAVVGAGLDLLTKHWVFQWRGLPRADNEWWIWEGYVGIETALNTGALFGLGAGKTHWFALLSVVAFVGILIWLFVGGAARDRTLTLSLGCVTGGIFGNLYDRLGLWSTDGHWDGVPIPEQYQTAVRDWILLRYGQYTWPNFNIADCLLVFGAGLLVWHAFQYREPTAPDEKFEKSSSGTAHSGTAQSGTTPSGRPESAAGRKRAEEPGDDSTAGESGTDQTLVR